MNENKDLGQEAYIRRFNEGYVIQKYLPELGDKLFPSNQKSAGFRAMQDGRNQFLSEKLKERLPTWLTRDPNKLASRSLGREKDKPNEPER